MERKRDYKREYELRKDSQKEVKTKLPNSLYDEFMAKVELDGTNKNAIVKKWIEEYVYGNKK